MRPLALAALALGAPVAIVGASLRLGVARLVAVLARHVREAVRAARAA